MIKWVREWVIEQTQEQVRTLYVSEYGAYAGIPLMRVNDKEECTIKWSAVRGSPWERCSRSLRWHRNSPLRLKPTCFTGFMAALGIHAYLGYNFRCFYPLYKCMEDVQCTMWRSLFIKNNINKYHSIGPILDDRLKEKILKPWKGALSSNSVCLSVCLCVCPCAGYRSHLLT